MSDDMQERITKLLAKAADESTPEAESEALLERAHTLMLKYNIDAKLLSLKAQVFLAPEVQDAYIVPPFVKSKTSLLSIIARSFNCNVITYTSTSAARNGGTSKVEIIGFPNDIESAKMLYLSAIVVGQTNSDNRRRAGNTSKAYHTSYWNGFAYGIYEKLQNSVTKTEAQAETDAPGTALVLLDAKKQVEDFISKRHPRLKKNASSKTTSSSGFQAGMSDGKNADLYQRNRVKTNHKAISSLFFTVGRSVKTAFNAST